MPPNNGVPPVRCLSTDSRGNFTRRKVEWAHAENVIDRRRRRVDVSLLREVFSSPDIRLYTARSGDEAISILDRIDIDVVLTDS